MCTTALQQLTVAEERMVEAIKLLNMVSFITALSGQVRLAECS